MRTGGWFTHSTVFSSPAQSSTGSECENRQAPAYDPELLYVECQECGKPVLWEAGRTRALVTASGLDLSLLDEYCFILSEGCPVCMPDIYDYQMYMVRLRGVTTQELVLLYETRGHA